SQPGFPVLIDYSLSGSDSASVGYVNNPEGAVSVSLTDYATLTHLADVEGNTFLTIQDQLSQIAAGSFVGFDIYNSGILSTDLINIITISTYLDGVLMESFSSSDLSLLSNTSNLSGRQTVGFVTSGIVDEVRITLTQDLLVDLGSTRVYSAVILNPCAGPDLVCNTPLYLHTPTFPVVIDGSRTGITGALCVLCDVVNPDNVVDEDTNNYANIILTAGVLATGSIAVEDLVTTYQAGTFAGFHIYNTSLLDADLLANISITTYLNGVEQESASGTDELISVGSDLLVTDGEHILGFVTTFTFDEIEISVENTLNVNLGTTRVYGANVMSLCEGTIGCESTFWMTLPEFPVVINAARTGMDGIHCGACSVQNEWSVNTDDQEDYATINITPGVTAMGSIAVLDLVATYPGGIKVGFAIEDVNTLLEAILFNSLTISTYNNNVLQESATGSQLLNITVNLNWLDPGPGVYNVGFTTTLDFDEVRITVGSLAAVNNIINVYGAFLNTENIDPALCAALPVTWLDFDVRKDQLKSQLTWTTAREFNNAGYEVQRSPDGRIFSTIGLVNRATIDATINSYGFIDEHPVNGMNYYRIKQTDFDGKYQYSAVKSLSFTKESLNLSVWPNPVSDILTIELGQDNISGGRITLINASGAIIRQAVFNEKEYLVQLQLNDLEPGYYNLIIENAEDRRVEKIMVLR
ncbi:MAG: T9SS type A sorting domain-containing protein, partial [Bacteroidota bacterium]|nr:T9SS type A sorting domain-containing protein [Bacteroidota bacterium]